MPLPSAFSIIGLILVGLVSSSCNEPLITDTSDRATWKIDWVINRDARCVATTDIDVASRHRILATTTFEVQRASGDERAEVPIVNVSTGAPSIAYQQYSNCDPEKHGDAQIIRQPAATTPPSVTGAVVRHPGIDSLRVRIDWVITPAVVRIQMKDSSRTIVETTVVDSVLSFEFVVPYTWNGATGERYVRSADERMTTQYSMHMKMVDRP